MQPKVVQNIMGHQHYSATIDIYIHISEAKYEEEIDKFGMAMEEVDMLESEEMEEVNQDEGQRLGMMM